MERKKVNAASLSNQEKVMPPNEKRVDDGKTFQMRGRFDLEYLTIK